MPFTPLTIPHGLPSIITTAITNLETIQQTRHSIRGAAEPLSSISTLASALIDSLQLIKDIPSLQTLRVGEQVYLVMDLASRLGASMLVIAADSINNRRSHSGLSMAVTTATTSSQNREDQDQDQNQGQEITPDDYVYGHLQTMAGQLAETKDKLFKLVKSVLVGVSGNPKDGFRVDRKELMAVNERVRDVMPGVEMRLWERLRGRIEESGDGGGEDVTVIELDDADIEYLGLPRVSEDMVEQWRATVGEETGITRESEQ